MQAILVFLAVTAIVGSRGARAKTPFSRGLILAMSVALALALYSRRVV